MRSKQREVSSLVFPPQEVDLLGPTELPELGWHTTRSHFLHQHLMGANAHHACPQVGFGLPGLSHLLAELSPDLVDRTLHHIAVAALQPGDEALHVVLDATRDLSGLALDAPGRELLPGLSTRHPGRQVDEAQHRELRESPL